ncbi:nucleolar protein 16-like [Pollicipes pollicipes]|uniref:nucleolar protein 16-like n=1 Tax=Pollicipes pollicipes TaxID=41117 RepID=UPI001884E187|nr:nucleolar protein 16-like [Pollicipes pollicipes]
MGKSVKQRKKKKYLYNVNRRKLQQKTKKKLLPRIPCEAIREAWDSQKHTKANLEAMGLAFKLETAMPVQPQSDSEDAPAASRPRKKVKKPEVVPKLEEQANRPQERRLRLPKQQVAFVERMLDSHGQDFRKMARDQSNHYQLTPKQIRRLVMRFWDIPEHFTPYMKRKGLLEKPSVEDDDE